MKYQAVFTVAAATLAALMFTQCVVVDDTGRPTQLPGNAPGTATQLPGTPPGTATQLPDRIPVPGFSRPLTAIKGPGSVTIREGSRTLTSFRTAAPNVEQTRWYREQEQIIVKSRGNHGPATIQLFDSRNGRQLGRIMAYEAANGPAWARSMAE